MTMINVALDVLKNVEAMKFDDLWDEVQEKSSTCKDYKNWTKKEQLSKKAEFYKLLLVDGRFIRVTGEAWSLVENQTQENLKKMKGFIAQEEIEV